jgi:hypothetical protein
MQHTKYYTSTHEDNEALCCERPSPARGSLPISNKELLSETRVSNYFNFQVPGSRAYRIDKSTEVEEDGIEGNHTRCL